MNPRLKSLIILGGALLMLGVASTLAYVPLIELLAGAGDSVGFVASEWIALVSQVGTVLGSVLLGGGIVAHVTVEALAERLGRPGAVQIMHGQRHTHDPYGADWDPDS